MINNCVEINMTQYKELGKNKGKVILFDLGIKWGICRHKLTDNEVKVKERNCFNKKSRFKSEEMEPFFLSLCCVFLSLSLSLSLPSITSL